MWAAGNALQLRFNRKIALPFNADKISIKPNEKKIHSFHWKTAQNSTVKIVQFLQRFASFNKSSNQ